MSAYYNENDPKAAAWLRALIAENLIAPGDVDERSITDVKPHELEPYTQHHFFAGIGGWSLALRLAGWPDERPVRTGSCPCQPFSIAGHGLGEADDRHLWPHFRDLIAFGDPTIAFGEQVASPDGREWLARVRTDLEGLGYEVGAADLCAAGVGSPQPRQRLYWPGYPHRSRRSLRMGIGRNDGQKKRQAARQAAEQASVGIGRMVQSDCAGWQPGQPSIEAARYRDTAEPTGYWDSFDIAICDGGKRRRVEPGTLPVAYGVPSRVDLLRGFGNSICPQVAALFIRASLEAINER